jgi:hypothetical protein
VGLSALGWGLKLISDPGSLPSGSPMSAAIQNSAPERDPRTGVGGLLGAEPKQSKSSSELALARLNLLGVVRVGEATGLALISVDNQPPKHYRVGSLVVDSLELSRVDDQGVSLHVPSTDNPNTEELRLNLPKRGQASSAQGLSHAGTSPGQPIGLSPGVSVGADKRIQSK